MRKRFAEKYLSFEKNLLKAIEITAGFHLVLLLKPGFEDLGPSSHKNRFMTTPK
jgi:hypothetical protein